DRDVRGIGGERGLQPCLLARGETFTSCAEDVADPEQRVALAAAAAKGLLPDPAANVIDRGTAELDDMEGVQHAGGVLELVIDRVLVSLERVQCRDPDPLTKRLAPPLQPVAVGLPGSARDQVQQPRRGVRSASQVHHPGELLRTALARTAVMPDVLIYA